MSNWSYAYTYFGFSTHKNCNIKVATLIAS